LFIAVIKKITNHCFGDSSLSMREPTKHQHRNNKEIVLKALNISRP